MGIEPDVQEQVAVRRLSIARITAWLARQAELALTEIDLSLPQYRVLGLLGEGIALPSSLADDLDVRRPSITAVVDGLVARGLVIREPDAGDRRKVTHSITDEGRRVLGTADASVEERLISIAAVLDDPDLVAGALEGLARWGPALIERRNSKRRQPVTS